LLKRAQKGTLPLVDAVKKLQAEILEGSSVSEEDIAGNAKKIGLFLLGVAYQKFGGGIEGRQEILVGISVVLMYTYGLEGAVWRSHVGRGAAEMATVFSATAMDKIESTARGILAACSEGDSLRTNLAVLRRYTRHMPANTIALRREIAARLLSKP